MNKKHTMPSYLVELEHELSAALIKVDDQRELLRLSQEENNEKHKDIIWSMGERSKLHDRIKQLEEMYEGEIQSLKYNIDRVMGMYAAKDNQIFSLREEFRELLGTDDIEQGVDKLRDLKQLASVRLGYIKQLETENDALRADLLLWHEQEVKP